MESAQPMIGWMPEPAIFSENSSAPNMLLVSVSAKRRLVVGLGEFGEPRDRQRAFEQRIGRMKVEMDEIRP